MFLKLCALNCFILRMWKHALCICCKMLNLSDKLYFPFVWTYNFIWKNKQICCKPIFAVAFCKKKGHLFCNSTWIYNKKILNLVPFLAIFSECLNLMQQIILYSWRIKTSRCRRREKEDTNEEGVLLTSLPVKVAWSRDVVLARWFCYVCRMC